MLSLLLDANIPPQVARQLRAVAPELRVFALQELHDGRYRSADDAAILAEAHAQGLTLVTRDLKTIPPLLREWFERGIDHNGVILVDDRTIAEGDIGRLVRALHILVASHGGLDWTNLCMYLEAPD